MNKKTVKLTFEKKKRLDKALAEAIPDESRSYLQKLIKEGNVLVDGQVITTKKIKVNQDNTITVEIPQPVTLEATPENLDINIVYEDDDVLVVNKDQGMVVHPAPGHPNGTLVNAVLYHCDLSSINGVVRPGVVHRIDKDTSGLLMFAKNNNAHQSLAQQLKDHTVTRKYYAIVKGRVSHDKGTIKTRIGRHPKHRVKMAVVNDGGKIAITHFKVIERYRLHSLVELELETGRTHQIRVHMKYINNPLVGDLVYGNKDRKINYDGQLLHAKTLGFVHPTTHEYMEFDSELPKYFEEILQKVKTI